MANTVKFDTSYKSRVTLIVKISRSILVQDGNEELNYKHETQYKKSERVEAGTLHVVIFVWHYGV